MTVGSMNLLPGWLGVAVLLWGSFGSPVWGAAGDPAAAGPAGMWARGEIWASPVLQWCPGHQTLRQSLLNYFELSRSPLFPWKRGGLLV